MNEAMQKIAEKSILDIQRYNAAILERIDPQCDDVSLQATHDLVNQSTPNELAELLFLIGCKAEQIGDLIDNHFEEMAEQMAYEKESSEALKNQLKFIQQAFDRKLR